MNLLGLLFLLIAHYISGRGVLQVFRLELKPLAATCLSFITGVFMLSLVPCIMQLLGITFEASNTVISISVFTALCSIPLLVMWKRDPKKIWSFNKPALPTISEVPFLIFFIYLSIVSVWRCFYYAPVAADMLSGQELLAEFAVREKTMISSVFTLDLQLDKIVAANIFKSPFITGLQIIYKILVQPFGQMWLSVLFLSFTVYLYSLLRQRIHPLIAGLLLLFYITIPELYVYSYIMLYDYSNMIFFFIGYYSLFVYTTNNKLSYLAWAAFMLGVATYVRTETLILVGFSLPVLSYHLYKQKLPGKKQILYGAGFLLTSAFFYWLCIDVFVKNFIFFPLDASSLINSNFADVSVFFGKMQDMAGKLIFAKQGEQIYGYFIYFFCLLLIADLVWPRKFSRESLIALYGIAVVYVGLAFIGYIIPSIVIATTIKRGLFKALPMAAWYMANSGLLQRLSSLIYKWEQTHHEKGKVAIAPALKKVVLSSAALLTLLLFFAIPHYNAWLTEKILDNEVSISEQSKHMDVEERRVIRYGEPYKLYREMAATLADRKDAVVLLPPNKYIYHMMGNTEQSVVPPEIFYYFTGVRALIPTSPDVWRADWAMIVTKQKIRLLELRNKKRIDSLLKIYQPYND